MRAAWDSFGGSLSQADAPPPALQGALKLADLGLARRVDATSVSRGVGTLAYMSPAAFSEQPSAPDDIWSLGVVTVELASGSSPQDLVNSQPKVDSLLATIPSSFSQAYRTTASQMLQMDPSRRPTAAALLRSPLLLPMAKPAPEANSVVGLANQVDSASWMAPLREPGDPR